MSLATCPKRKCRLSYSITFKLGAVRHAEVNGNRATARYLGINEKQIRDWRSKKLSLMNTNCNAKRLKGAGRQMNERSGNRSSLEADKLKHSNSQAQQQSVIENIENIFREKSLQMAGDVMHCWKMRNPVFMHRSENLDIFRAFRHPAMLLQSPRYEYGIAKNLEKEREFHEKITCALALLDLKTPIIERKCAE